jgi:DNA-directed RNA polymerase specialized sigma24 family protein
LVRRVALEDRSALDELHIALSTQLLQHLRSNLPDPAHAESFVNATFFEVWLMARFHTAPDTDVCAWIGTIVARRVGDGRSVSALMAEVYGSGPTARPY